MAEQQATMRTSGKAGCVIEATIRGLRGWSFRERSDGLEQTRPMALREYVRALSSGCTAERVLEVTYTRHSQGLQEEWFDAIALISS